MHKKLSLSLTLGVTLFLTAVPARGVNVDTILYPNRCLNCLEIISWLLVLCIITMFGWVFFLNKKYNKQLENLSNSTFDVVFFHQNGIIVYLNERFSQLTGYDKVDLIGRSIMEFMDPKAKMFYEKNLASIIKAKDNSINELTMIRKDGTPLDIEIFSRPFMYKRNEVRIVALRDITERKQYISALLDTQYQLKELVATKDRIFSIIAHDLKNPFNTILGFADLLKKNADLYPRDELKEIAAMIFQSSQNAHNLLNNLLNWSMAQTGKLQYRPDELNLKLIVSRTMGLLLNQAKVKNITLAENITPETTVYADIEMLETILRNLVANAIKYTPDNGSITVSCNTSDHNVVISVTDNGIGMNEKALKDLFRIDHICSTLGTKNESGTGLGLILCDELLKRHNSSFTVTSQVGVGTTFSFALPRQETKLNN